MRIEAYNQVQQLYRTNKVNKTPRTESATHTDQLSFSSFGKEIRAAQEALGNVPDVREELTAPIKERIQNGTYSVDTATFAEKLLQEYEEMR